jgi:hypothetical protein
MTLNDIYEKFDMISIQPQYVAKILEMTRGKFFQVNDTADDIYEMQYFLIEDNGIRYVYENTNLPIIDVYELGITIIAIDKLGTDYEAIKLVPKGKPDVRTAATY